MEALSELQGVEVVIAGAGGGCGEVPLGEWDDGRSEGIPSEERAFRMDYRRMKALLLG